MFYRVDGLVLALDAPPEALKEAVCRKLRIAPENIGSVRLHRRSVDARRGDVRWNCSAVIELESNAAPMGAQPYEEKEYAPPAPGECLLQARPVVIGAGPSGTFAALLLARLGYRPLVLERGEDVDTRRNRVERFFATGELDPACNVQFGEGGAGTFSDGKLVTRIKDPRCGFVLKTYAAFGAPQAILTDARPHVGSDLLVDIARNLRREIESLGGEYRFGCRMERILTQDDAVCAVRLENGEEIPAQAVVLATGHSARDVFEMLHEQGAPMEAKPFAVGLRVEHPREYIDRLRYGKRAGDPRVGAADYHLSAHVFGREVYSFCMCPGGQIINASNEPGMLSVNGMSLSARDGINSNAALVASVTPDDFGKGVLDGLNFQRKIERMAFGEGYAATVQRMEDFIKRRPSRRLGSVQASIQPSAQAGDAAACLPENIAQAIRGGILQMDRQLPGFLLGDALLTAAETRTSSPVRILRGDTMESLWAKGLFPAGEGAGYAGGITSAAADGMRAAEGLIAQWRSK
ncbi:MAG: FAD-dependent oxidoreductase [Eubacteriales bacterium]|nr:FAD-dependent oxidoreductase [Eubacteriales bacterium]